MAASEREETTNEKGDRHENEARHILKRVYGAGVSKVGCRGVHDPFGFVDLIAMRPGEPVKFVQIKTNGFSADDRRKYRNRTRKLPPQSAVFEVWIRHDRQGWVLHEYDPEEREFEEFRRINVCDRDEAGDRYREFATEDDPDE